jgi:hypothetical protein
MERELFSGGAVWLVVMWEAACAASGTSEGSAEKTRLRHCCSPLPTARTHQRPGDGFQSIREQRGPLSTRASHPAKAFDASLPQDRLSPSFGMLAPQGLSRALVGGTGERPGGDTQQKESTLTEKNQRRAGRRFVGRTAHSPGQTGILAGCALMTTREQGRGC